MLGGFSALFEGKGLHHFGVCGSAHSRHKLFILCSESARTSVAEPDALIVNYDFAGTWDLTLRNGSDPLHIVQCPRRSWTLQR